MAYVDSLWEIVSQIASSQNVLVGHLNGGRYDQAENVLDAGLKSYRGLDRDFSALEKRRVSPDFQEFYDLAAKNRSLQIDAFDAAREMIRLGRAAADVPTMNSAILEWNKAIDAYNSNNTAMGKLTKKIAEESRKR